MVCKNKVGLNKGERTQNVEIQVFTSQNSHSNRDSKFSSSQLLYVFVLHPRLQQLILPCWKLIIKCYAINKVNFKLPKGSGILKNKSFLINPSAAITVRRMVLVLAEFDIVTFLIK